MESRGLGVAGVRPFLQLPGVSSLGSVLSVMESTLISRVLPVPKLLSIISPMLLLTLLVATLLVWRKLKHQTSGEYWEEGIFQV